MNCAETRTFTDECSDLQICVLSDTIDATTARKFFPPRIIRTASNYMGMLDMLNEGQCNVMMTDVFFLQNDEMYEAFTSGKYVASYSAINFKYFSIAVRNTDAQWSDLVHGAVEGVLRGSWNGVAAQNMSLCPLNSTNSLDINFMNAPTCAGNSYEINDRTVPRDFMKVIDLSRYNMSQGFVWAPNYGALGCASCQNALSSGTLRTISQRGMLNCAVIDEPSNPGLSKMGEQYCRAVAVAVFHGDARLANITRVGSFDEASIHLNNGDLDIVAGESRFGLSGSWSPDLSTWNSEQSGDYAFSLPYYYFSLNE